jgi:hypothetical protein
MHKCTSQLCCLENELLFIPPCSTLVCHCPERCAITLTRQHIITSSVFNIRASSLTWHFAGCRVWEIDFLFSQSINISKLYSCTSQKHVHFNSECWHTIERCCVAGILGAAANGWLVTGFLISPLLNIKTHLLMLNLTVNCLGRGLLAGFPFAGTSILAGRFVAAEETK